MHLAVAPTNVRAASPVEGVSLWRGASILLLLPLFLQTRRPERVLYSETGSGRSERGSGLRFI